MTSIGLRRRLARVEAVDSIQRLMGMYCYLSAAGRGAELLGLFARRRPEVSAELADWGVFVGLDRVRQVVVEPLSRMAAVNGAAARAARLDEIGDDRAGMLMESALMTPLIHVSPDASEARGLWMVLGAQSGRDPSGRLDATWTWVQFFAQFIVEDGEWRILHFRVAPRFRTSFSRSWAQTAADGAVKPPAGLIPPPDRPPSSQVPTDYALDRVPAYDPPAPEPYAWDRVDETVAPEEEPLARRLQRLEDIHAVSNLMSLHEYLHVANRNGEEFERCFAHQTEGVTFEPEDWGVWQGRDAIRACYVQGAPPPMPGMVTEHATTTAVIEVAEDGQTAKGVWVSPGHETFPLPDALPLACWSWGRYGIDFVKEDGVWKFWHFHIYTTFRTPYAVSWVESAVDPAYQFSADGETPPGVPGPSRPVTFNQPYHPGKSPALQPVPPGRYRSFAEAWSYTDPPA